MSDDQDQNGGSGQENEGGLLSGLIDNFEEQVGGKNSLLGGIMEVVKKNVFGGDDGGLQGGSQGQQDGQSSGQSDDEDQDGQADQNDEDEQDDQGQDDNDQDQDDQNA